MSGTKVTGRVIGGKYKVTGYQRSGRMGDHYVGRRVDTNEQVQIRILDSSFFDNDEAVRRFEREVRILRRIKHPCAPVLLDSGRTDDGLAWTVTEFVSGDLLSDVLEGAKRLPAERAAYFAAQIAMALDAAHGIGVVHRDLSPSNILVGEFGGAADSIKVLEFGLSRLQDSQGESEDTSLTAVGVRIGSPEYMAPEYIEEYALDHRADLYSLGIVLFQMLTGHPPFQGRPYTVMDMHMNSDAPPVRSVVSDAPEWIEALVQRLLAKAPDGRVQTAAEVVAVIEQGLGTRLLTVQAKAGSDDAPEAVPLDVQQPPQFEVDPILQSAIEKQIVAWRGSNEKPDVRMCYTVRRVAEPSLGHHVGLRAGSLVWLPDQKQVGLGEPRLYLHPADERRYLFTASSDPTSEVTEVVATGADLGVELYRTPQHVRAHYKPLQPDSGALRELWEEGAWEDLEKLTWRTLTKQRGSAGMLNTGLFSKFLGKDRIKLREHPALLYHGVAQYERGERTAGLEQIREYQENYASDFDEQHRAVGLFYLGQELERRNELDAASDLFVQAWLLWPAERFARKIYTITGQQPDARVWYGHQFPDYNLEEVDSQNRSVRLYQTLGRMRGHQILIVCLLGGFRGNLAYSDFMMRYTSYNAFFAEFIAGVHVVTHRVRRDAKRPQHYVGEDHALQAGLPVRVLEDYRAFVQRAVKPPNIPTIYALNRDGYVVHEGALDSVDLWETLALTGRLRMENLASGS